MNGCVNNGASMTGGVVSKSMLYKASRACWRKKRFESVSEAKRYNKRRQKRFHDGINQYAYNCSICKGAHLTKVEIKNGRTI